MNGIPAIRLRQVSKWLGGAWVLRTVDLDVYPGEVLALVGPSGTGKSVLLKHIIGLMVPERGDVQVHGESITRADYATLGRMRRSMGYVFQDGALIDWLSIRENLLLAIPDEEREARPAVTERRIRDAIAFVNLPASVLDKLPAQLSGGMRKRTGVARATLNEPRIVLYDEPTTGLDPQNVLAINDAILQVRKRMGAASVVVTHDMASVAKIADRVVMLAEGRFCFEGSVHEFFTTTSDAVIAFRASVDRQTEEDVIWPTMRAAGTN